MKNRISILAPGLALSLVCASLGVGIQWLVTSLFGFTIVEALVIALILGIVWRNTLGIAQSAHAGTRFASKEILEFAVVTLGASVDFRSFAQAGPIIVVVVGVVIVSTIALSKVVGRFFGLTPNTATLLGVGNGICGNSAIAAVAPLIGAGASEVASSIGFTAVLSVFVVLGLPFLPHMISLSDNQYGIVAGMVVYAVPQVLAATFAVNPQSVAIATLVKLTRVLFLAPVALFFSFRQGSAAAGRFSLRSAFPWFMRGFIFFALLRTMGLLSPDHGDKFREIGRIFTIVSMGAIGLNVDLKALAGSSRAIIATVLASLLFLLVAALLTAQYVHI